MAIGKSSDLGFAQAAGVSVQRGIIGVDEKTLETSVQGVFAGGDAVVFPGAIVHAVADGRKAASAIDTYLGGDGIIEETLVHLPPLNPWVGREEGFAFRPRLSTRKIPATQRTGFDEIDLGFDAHAAATESSRCLQCDLRLALGAVAFPPEHVLRFTEMNVQKVPETGGAFRIMNEEKVPVVIKGTENMCALLLEYLESNPEAKFFDFEADKMYTTRESELIQQHLQKYGEMPSAGDKDDLF